MEKNSQNLCFFEKFLCIGNKMKKNIHLNFEKQNNHTFYTFLLSISFPLYRTLSLLKLKLKELYEGPLNQ